MKPSVDVTQAAAFRQILEADEFDFRTFDDTGRDKRLVRTMRGQLHHRAHDLVNLNRRRAGVFVTINETDGRGITTKHIIRVRAVWIDMDNHKPPGRRDLPILPHLGVQSSTNGWHYYWLVRDFPLDAFKAVQSFLAGR